MKCYKGFDKDLKCRGYQYEIGKEYEEQEAEIRSKGFHACEYPMDVFGYYNPASSRYCEVDLDANDQTDGDSKRVGKCIKIGAEIGIPGIVKASVEYIKNHVDWDNSEVSGKESIAMAMGYKSKAKGALGCFLVLAEWSESNGEYHIVDVKAVKVDGVNIKENTYYTLADGLFVEVGNE